MTSESPPRQGDPGWEEWRACGRKRRYASDLDPDIPGWLITYRCRFCKCWHTTSGKKMTAVARNRQIEAQRKRRLEND